MSRIAVGGAFNGAGGVRRHGLAAVSWPTGAPIDWDANLDFFPASLARSGQRLFVNGQTTLLNTTTLIEIDIPTATRSAWSATVSGTVNVLQVSGRRLFVAGSFTAIDGLPRRSLALLDISGTPTLDAWSPTIVDASTSFFRVEDMRVVSGVALVSGWTDASPSGAPYLVAAVDASSGTALPWNPTFTSTGNLVYFEVTPDRVWVSGTFRAVNGQPASRTCWLRILRQSSAIRGVRAAVRTEWLRTASHCVRRPPVHRQRLFRGERDGTANELEPGSRRQLFGDGGSRWAPTGSCCSTLFATDLHSIRVSIHRWA